MSYFLPVNPQLFYRFALSGLLLILMSVGGCNNYVTSNNDVGNNPTSALGPRVDTRNARAEAGFETGDPGLLLMLVPEDSLPGSAELTAWADAASEVGVRLRTITDKQFLALGAGALKFAGLILPDQSHSIASNELLQAIRSYTMSGGNVMLVYDFGAFALDGNQKPTYPIPRSRLSDLAGVDYVMYDELREKSTKVGPVLATRSSMRELQVPPGKSIPYKAENDTKAGNNPNATNTSLPLTDATVPISQVEAQGAAEADMETLSGYLLGNLVYPSFVTRGTFKGKVLATSPQAGLVAGLRTAGKGQVLFVNLPLTYLKVMRTDGLPMHGFLHYFAHQVLGLAQLSPVPDAVAGLTLNWHLDSFAAQLPTLMLEKMGIFKDGPFSIDITAGPDAVVNGDAKGWNLDNNPQAKDLLRRLVADGHTVGSHGGWNHDYYGLQANEGNRGTFLPYLQKNANSIRQAISSPLRPYLGFESSELTNLAPGLVPVALQMKLLVDGWFGPPLREYSPPVGNNPTWAMDWLEQQGIVAAYFAGHTGLGPTRQYRDGQLRNAGMWVFPVTPAGKYATFEEFQTNKIPKQDIVVWHRESIDFVIAQNTTRMIYMHPNGANVWADVLAELLAYAKAKGSASFKWYTMTRLADFMTTRRLVQWTERRDAAGVTSFEISHPSSLREMVWLLPKSSYPDRPTSDNASVTLTDRGTDWEVRGGNTRKARFTARSQNNKPHLLAVEAGS